MRNSRKALADRLKQGRREWLVVLLLAGSPALAQQPASRGLGVLPPLPLETAGQAVVRSNPYCETETSQPATVQLTNGANQPATTVRLSPIGAAIGLNSINGTPRPTAARPSGLAPVMTIEPTHRSAVQSNPLIQSAHHGDAQLVETTVATAKPVTQAVIPSATGLATQASGSSILLVNPASKHRLTVKPNQAQEIQVASPEQPSEKTPPSQSLIPPLSAETEVANVYQAAASAQPTSESGEKPVTRPAASTTPATATAPKTVVTPSIEAASKSDPTATTASNSVEPVKAGKVKGQDTAQPKKPNTAQSKKPTKSVHGASIAAMLANHPDKPSKASAEKPTPIFFSLSDNLEVAPTSESKAEGKLGSKVDSSPIPARTEQPPLPAPVTLLPDGSIRTAKAPKPRPKPKSFAQPVLMARVPATAKPISSHPKSILATKEPASPATEKEQLRVAPMKEFRPRSHPNSTKSVTAAKPFNVSVETAESKTKPESSAASSVLANSPPSKTESKRNSGNGQLTPTPSVNSSDQVADAPSTEKSGKSIIKVERPSPKELAKENPHHESPKPAQSELKNPFKKREVVANRPSTIDESEADTNQTVTVEKYTINKENRKPRVAVNAPERDSATPIAKGIVKPLSLGKTNELAESPAPNSKTPEVSQTVTKKPAKNQAESVTAPKSTKAAAVQRKTPAVNKNQVVAGQTDSTKRYRPPVAVQTLPGTVERQPTASSVRTSKVQPVPDMVLESIKANSPAFDLHQAMSLDTASDLKDRGLILGPHVKLTPLHMNQAQVRSLTLGGSVRGVRVGDKAICQAFASGPNQLKLIGTGIGITRLVVWAQKSGNTDEVLMRAFEIHVDEVVPSEGNSIQNTAELLNQSIQNVFPNCQATVKLVGGELWVSGQCDSQSSAEKIIRMVRKSCLIPVRDQLVVK